MIIAIICGYPANIDGRAINNCKSQVEMGVTLYKKIRLNFNLIW